MSYNFTTSYGEMICSEENKSSIREERRGERILNYAISKYNCKFSNKFINKLKNEFYLEKDIPEYTVVDSLVREWEVWKPYVSEDSFSNFIEDGLKSLICIQATATFHSPNLRGYIGNKAAVIKKLPLVLATSVTWNGSLRIDGQPV